MDRDELKERLAALSPQQRVALEERLLARRATATSSSRIPRRARGTASPLSLAQQRLWFLDQLNPGRPDYNEPTALRLEGALDTAALRRALDEIVARHEVLRTVFVSTDGQPGLELRPPRPVDLDLVELDHLDPDARTAALEAVLVEAARRPFDLTRDLMLRGRLVRIAPDDHVLLLAKHHIASDGWSAGVLLRELSALYAAFARGEPSPLPELPIQYADFALWQQRWLESGELTRQLQYWRGRLAGAPQSLELPTDHPRPAVQSGRGRRITRVLPLALGTALKALARSESATLFMAGLAGFVALLHRLTGQTDVLVASPIAGRTRLELEPLLGFFVGTLVLRGDVAGDPTVRELLRQVRATALDAYGHQEVPFEKLVEELAPERSLRETPLVQVMFALQSTREQREPALPGLRVARMPVHSGTAKFDLTLYVTEIAEGLEVVAEFSTDLFEAETIGRWLDHFEVLLEGMTRDPECRVSALPVLREAERHRLLVEWNHTERAYPRDATLHGLFEAQAARAPGAVALIDGADRITYDVLERRANRVAHHLRDKLAIAPGAVVGVCLPRSAAMVAAILGALKAGAAYLPLDPASPPARLALMLEDARPAVILTASSTRAALPADAPCLEVEPEGSALAGAREEAVRPVASDDPLAYVIYTSGSSGRPKGVRGRHRGAVNRATWMWETHPFAPDEVCCAKTSIGFVDSVWELFGGLLAGRPTVLVPDDAVLDPARLLALLAREGVTRLVLVPSLLEALLDVAPDLAARVPRLRCWVSSGERLSRELAARFLAAAPDRLLLNLYGCSEVSADSTAHAVAAAAPGPVPIGRPIANTRVYVLDGRGQPVPVGVPGELHVGGDGVARGYLGREDLTAERFLPDPWSTDPAARLYRTGDLVRWRADGALEYLGRLDDQVKIRGHRVERGEVEAALVALPEVREAAVLARSDARGAPELVAYVTAASGALVDGGEIRSRLRASLPDAMVPAVVVPVESLPRTSSGKLDRLALPVTGSAPPRVAAPTNPLEAQILAVWEALLPGRAIGVTDRFFDVGGHSLLAVRMMHEVERACGRTLPLTALFSAPTVEGLARALLREEAPRFRAPILPLREGAGAPFFFLHGDYNGGGFYSLTLARLTGGGPFHAVHPHGLAGGEIPATIEAMAEDRLSALRAVQPHGPYRLGGHCAGGLVALEMARHLAAAGERVEALVLIDSVALNARFRGLSRLAGAIARARSLGGDERRAVFLRLRTSALRAESVGRSAPGRAARVALAALRELAGLPASLVGDDPVPGTPEHLQFERDVRYRHAVRTYVPRPYDGRLTVLVPEQRAGVASDLWWGLVSDQVRVVRVPGDHLTCVTRHAPEVAAALDGALAAAAG
jgi:amino acid adenylation domain-containing protein